MIQIENEELYYSLPSYTPNKFTQHTPENLVYKTMMFTPDRFYADELRRIAEQKWGTPLSNQVAGHALRVLYENGYITRRKIRGTYRYYKTQLYYREISGWLQKNETIPWKRLLTQNVEIIIGE